MSLFQVGDRVWSPVFGWGQVESDYYSPVYPVYVRFSDGYGEGYTAQGESDHDLPRSLFFAEVVPHKEALERPKYLVEIKSGDVVLLHTGELGVSLEDSPRSKEAFSYYTEVPQGLDYAYEQITIHKNCIHKIVGNINNE